MPKAPALGEDEVVPYPVEGIKRRLVTAAERCNAAPEPIAPREDTAETKSRAGRRTVGLARTAAGSSRLRPGNRSIRGRTTRNGSGC
jgi:hypothetical protein